MNPISRRGLAAVASLFALCVIALLPMSAVAAPGAITVDVTMGSTCIYGSVAAGATDVRVIWKDAELNVKTNTMVDPDANGAWGACAGLTHVETGDRIRVRVGSASHLLVVPELTLVQNRVNNVYRGRGPAGSYVRLICGIFNGFEPCVQSWKLKVNSAGNWGYNPHWDVTGGDFMSVTWTSEEGDKVRRHNYAPYVVVTIDRAAVSGATRPGSESIVMVKNATTLGIRGVAEVVGRPLDGEFGFGDRFTKEEGERVRPHVGNIITSDMAADAEWTIQNIHASPNASTGQITGQCPTPTGMFVRAHASSGGSTYTWPESDGSFEIEFLPFESGDRLLISCDLPTGDRIQKWFAVP